jgi:hypothetical protein
VVHIGDFPPSPLQIELTLPSNRSYLLRVVAEYADPPGWFTVRGPMLTVSRRVRFEKTFEFQT